MSAVETYHFIHNCKPVIMNCFVLINTSRVNGSHFVLVVIIDSWQLHRNGGYLLSAGNVITVFKSTFTSSGKLPYGFLPSNFRIISCKCYIWQRSFEELSMKRLHLVFIHMITQLFDLYCCCYFTATMTTITSH